jgi:titin
VVNWSDSGIVIFDNGNTIAGNFIGIAPNGSTAAGNGTDGVLVIGGSGNTIGGTTASDRNVLSGNGGGIQIQRTSPSSPVPATNNVVEGNYVGTDAAGDAVVANAADGISLVWGAQGNTIGGSAPGAGNLVSGNGRIGISVFDTSGGNSIEGNYVGTNAAGTGALGGNPECGIVLISGSNTVGGTSAGAGNVISGNGGGCGLTIGGSGSNTVEGNYIGTNAAGTAALGNGTTGSDVPAGVGIQSSNNQVGGSAVGAGNVISGNLEPGVWFDSSSATANVVQGNYIGTDSTTTRALGNSGDGVLIGGGAQGNTIGGTAPGDANTIAHNTSNGVEISFGSGNPIEGNSIFANAGLGIALTSGGNANEAAPTVLSALSAGSSTTISGTAATGRRVEVFANPSCSDPEGALFLGSTVSSTGNWSLTVPAVAIGNGITATATDPPSGNTSQFSTCHANQLPPPAILPPPLITSITPRFGSIRGGTTVTIVGQYLTATSVSFGSRPAARFTVHSQTQITAVSPRRSAPGVVDVSVVTAGGKSAAVAADKFTYTACVVPRLKGKTLKNARKALKRADCRLGKVKPKGQTTGHVKTQRPKAGRVLAPGSKVQVKLARNSSKPRQPRLRSHSG